MSGCNYTSVASSLRAQVDAALGFTPQHYLWYFATRNIACGWQGLAEAGSPSSPARDSWHNASATCLTLGQIHAANFGVQHSSSLKCGNARFPNDPSTCTHDEYGDRYDVMGSACRHMNGQQKGYQAYFGGCNRVRVTSTGTFSLLPFEVECNGIQVLQIPMPVQNRVIATGGSPPVNEPVKYYYL